MKIIHLKEKNLIHYYKIVPKKVVMLLKEFGASNSSTSSGVILLQGIKKRKLFVPSAQKEVIRPIKSISTDISSTDNSTFKNRSKLKPLKQMNQNTLFGAASRLLKAKKDTIREQLRQLEKEENTTIKNIISPSKMRFSQNKDSNNYIISDHGGDTDWNGTSEDEEELARRYCPPWAKKENLHQLLKAQKYIDPDKIFAHKVALKNSCDLTKVFKGFKQRRRFKRRTSSGNWFADQLKWQEEMKYRQAMGFE